MNSYFDSIEKIRHYLVMTSYQDDKEIKSPKRFSISKTFWRDYKCLENCGACCRAFSMDFWEDEFEEFKKIYPEKVELFKPRVIELFGKKDTIFSNYEESTRRLEENNFERCQFLNKENGWCMIHEKNAFTCQFELNRLQYFPKQSRCILNKKKFRNSWRWTKMDGTKGVYCDTLFPASKDVVEKVLNRDLPYFQRLKYLLKRYKINTERIELIISTLTSQAENLLQGNDIDDIVEIESGMKNLF